MLDLTEEVVYVVETYGYDDICNDSACLLADAESVKVRSLRLILLRPSKTLTTCNAFKS